MRAAPLNEQLRLENVRSVLIRLEETIIFGLIERAQFRRNAIIYRAGAFPQIGSECLADYLLHETERVHARMRRYTSPDEHPFFNDLPPPLLPPLCFEENPLRPNSVNLNPVIRQVYETEMIPYICEDGDDRQYGSSSVCDVQCLQALSRRIHYGKFVAESKYRSDPARFDALVRRRDRSALLGAVTDPAVERRVLERVRIKAETYGKDVDGSLAGGFRIPPGHIVEFYRRWIIPLTKRVEVEYLLSAGLERNPTEST